jgi:hypothetical protein
MISSWVIIAGYKESKEHRDTKVNEVASDATGLINNCLGVCNYVCLNIRGDCFDERGRFRCVVNMVNFDYDDF